MNPAGAAASAALGLSLLLAAPLLGQQPAPLVPKLDSLVDEMSGKRSFIVAGYSMDTVTWQYGRLVAYLAAKCEPESQPIWVVGAKAPPKKKSGSSVYVSMELKTDSAYLPSVDAVERETGGHYWLFIQDTLFYRYIEDSPVIRMRWTLTTNERVMFRFPGKAMTRPYRQLRERCLGTTERQRALTDSLHAVCELLARGVAAKKPEQGGIPLPYLLGQCATAAGQGPRALRDYITSLRAN